MAKLAELDIRFEPSLDSSQEPARLWLRTREAAITFVPDPNPPNPRWIGFIVVNALGHWMERRDGHPGPFNLQTAVEVAVNRARSLVVNSDVLLPDGGAMRQGEHWPIEKEDAEGVWALVGGRKAFVARAEVRRHCTIRELQARAGCERCGEPMELRLRIPGSPLKPWRLVQVTYPSAEGHERQLVASFCDDCHSALGGSEACKQFLREGIAKTPSP